jgi:hypothetical protein
VTPPSGSRSDPWTDLALTLPIFVSYHLGVAFLPMRNAADPLTARLALLAEHSLPMYCALAVGLGAVLVVVTAALGQGQPFRRERFALVAGEGLAYAIALRFIASAVVGSLPLAPGGAGMTPLAGLIMSLGAGFYEEVAFRVLLFGLGARLVVALGFGARLPVELVWGLVTAALFSGWHYFGDEPFALRSFVFRTVCGVVFVVIYRLRGFAPVVWTHALYDIGVMVL